jgi:hypothetical protein
VRDAYRVVEEAHQVDPRDESGLVAAAKRLRTELLQTKAELERETRTARAPLPAVQPARALGPRAGGGPNANLLSGYEPPVGPDQTTEAKTGEINYLWRSKFVPPLQSPSVPGAPFGRP